MDILFQNPNWSRFGRSASEMLDILCCLKATAVIAVICVKTARRIARSTLAFLAFSFC